MEYNLTGDRHHPKLLQKPQDQSLHYTPSMVRKRKEEEKKIYIRKNGSSQTRK